MIYISHRGNLKGPNPEKENHPDYLLAAVKQGFHVEVDAWFVDNKWWLGHDGPQYEVEARFFDRPKLWVHSKNIEAFVELIGPKFCVHTFFHDTDDCTLTSRNWVWTYPGKLITNEKQIAVMPERFPDWDISKAGGICSDFPSEY